MEKKKHIILDHPVLGYFLLILFASVLTSAGSVIDSFLAGYIPGYAKEMAVSGKTIMSAMGVGVAIGALAAAFIFRLWFRPDFEGCIKTDGVKAALLMMLPALLLHYVGSIVSWFTFGTGNVFIAFLCASAPGFSEEISFRGLGIANYMRTIKEEKQITFIFWLSSIVFGAVHLSNLSAGGDLSAVIVQAVYATGVGMMLGAVYLRIGNLLPCIIAHMSLDFFEFVRADLYASGGVMKGMGAGDWITVGAAILAAVIALRLMNRRFYPEIMEIWKKKWNQS